MLPTPKAGRPKSHSSRPTLADARRRVTAGRSMASTDHQRGQREAQRLHEVHPSGRGPASNGPSTSASVSCWMRGRSRLTPDAELGDEHAPVAVVLRRGRVDEEALPGGREFLGVRLLAGEGRLGAPSLRPVPGPAQRRHRGARRTASAVRAVPRGDAAGGQRDHLRARRAQRRSGGRGRRRGPVCLVEVHPTARPLTGLAL